MPDASNGETASLHSLVVSDDELLQAKLQALQIAATRGRKRRAAKRVVLHREQQHSDESDAGDDTEDGVSVMGDDAASLNGPNGQRTIIRLAIRKRQQQGTAGKAGRRRKRDGNGSNENDEDIQSHDFAAAGMDDVAEHAPLQDVNAAANNNEDRPSPAGSYLELPTTAVSRPDSTTTELEDSDLDVPHNHDGLALADTATTSLAAGKNWLAPPSPYCPRRLSQSSSSSSSSSSSAAFQTPGELELQSPVPLISPSSPRGKEHNPFERSIAHKNNGARIEDADDADKPIEGIKRTDTYRSIDIDGPSTSPRRAGKKPERGSSLRIPANIPFIGSDVPTVGRSGTHLSYKKPKSHRRNGSYLASRTVEERTDDEGEDAQAVPTSPRQGSFAVQEDEEGEDLDSPMPRSRSRAGSEMSSGGGTGNFIRRTATLTKRKFPLRSNSRDQSGLTPAEPPSEHHHHPHIKSHRKRRSRQKNKKPVHKSPTDQLKEAAEHIVDSMHAAGYEHEELILKEDRVTEVLFENQRGIFLLGSRYGSGALLPGDPAKWAKLDSETGDYVDSPYDTSNHPLPTPAWRWHHQEWLVNMAGDVDAEGFSYSTRFGSKYWRGIPSLRFVVRRRMWIRTRYRPAIDPHTFTKLAKPSHTISRVHQKCEPDPTAGQQDHLSSIAEDDDNHDHRAPVGASSSVECPPESDDQASQNGLQALRELLEQRPPTIANPFVSWYSDSSRSSGSKKGKGRASDTPRHPFHKEDLIHANFARVARVLSRSTQLDRERLAWFEYWLEEREEKPLLVAMKYADSGSEDEISDQEDEEVTMKSRKEQRPDVRDVWDLVEDQLDALLQLFDYQDSRREFLILLAQIHDRSHPSHKYTNASSSEAYSELSPIHEHGSSSEMGGSPEKQENRKREDTHAQGHAGLTGRMGQERLHFAADVRRRLEEVKACAADRRDEG